MLKGMAIPITMVGLAVENMPFTTVGFVLNKNMNTTEIANNNP